MCIFHISAKKIKSFTFFRYKSESLFLNGKAGSRGNVCPALIKYSNLTSFNFIPQTSEAIRPRFLDKKKYPSFCYVYFHLSVVTISDKQFQSTLRMKISSVTLGHR